MFGAALARYENFLRIDPEGKAKDVIRARAVVWFCLAFCLIQFVNIGAMTISYGGWTSDHTIATFVILILLGAVNCLRYSKNYAAYGIFTTVLVVAGVLSSALMDHIGINSALIPILIMAPMLNGFISGPRIACITGVAMIAVVIVLYMASVTHNGIGTYEFSVREFQRALQAGFVITMVTVVSTIFSANIFRTFDSLEETAARTREAEAAKSQFLAAMSHELRTPLNGVIGLAEIMQKTSLDDEQQELIEGIDRSGRSLMAILNDIMDMLRIESNQIYIRPEKFDLQELIEGVATTWRLPAVDKGLALDYEIDDDASEYLIGDASRIRQVIAKIVSNAVKYTHEGTIRISASVQHRTDSREPFGHEKAILEIAIHDTGPGISKHAGEKIFDAFEQAESGSLRSQDGAGLGLAICQRLAKLMQGRVHFETVMGKGTTFYFSVPIEVTEMVSLASVAPEIVPGQIQGKRILVVEDNMINRMVAVRLLEGLGLECETAENGALCLDSVCDHEFDMILMDNHMPVMDGIKAMQEIRAMDGETCEIPIVACTADDVIGAREAMLQAGFDEFLAKPINSQSLYDVLIEALRKASMREAASTDLMLLNEEVA